MKLNKSLIILVALSLVLLTTRLINLKVHPIFTDEAIYIRWAQIALNDPEYRFISLIDGKQPLFVWLTAISLNFVTDPLVAGRLVSVFSGFLAIFGIYFLARELFNDKVALITSFFYLISPFTFLYDRLAIFDSLLTMLTLYATLFTVKLVKNPNFTNSVLAGCSLGFGTITKSSAFFFIYLLPFSAMLIKEGERFAISKFFKWLSFLLITALIAFTFYNLLRLSPLFYVIGQKNLEFIRPTREVLNQPFSFFGSNLGSIISWLLEYLTIPLFIISVASLMYGLGKKNLKIIFLSLYIFIPILAETFFNKVLYPRFTLFYYPYILIILSFGIYSLFQKYQRHQTLLIILAIPILLFPLKTSFTLLTKPHFARIPQSDSNQYFNDWPAGYGVKEAVGFVEAAAKDGPVYVATQGTFGLLPYALEIYLQKEPEIEIKGFWPLDPQNIPSEILDKAKSKKSFLILNEAQQEITNPYLVQILSIKKGTSKSTMRVYQIIP